MIPAFNQTIDYIESVLDDEIDEKKIAQLSGYSYPMFCRIFSILAGYSLGEYIRLRRLTKAAFDLRETTEKVIDIAMKYGYESSDAFALAFKRFHNNTPSEVRNGAVFKVFSSIKLSLTIRGGKNMDIKIERKGAFKIAGVKAKDIETSKCPEIWDALFQKASSDQLAKIGDGYFYGACFEINNENFINYIAAVDVKDEEKAKKIGLDILEIPEAEYAVVKLKGSVPKCIHEGWKYVMEVFFPEQGYKHAGTPDLEFYYDGDMNSPDYEMELWVPIVRSV